MTVHMISIRPSSLTIFFLHGALFFFPFISLYTFPRLTREERAKATLRKEIEDCAAEPKTMKISSSQLRRSSQMKLWFTRLHQIMVCDFWLFIYLFEIMKQIVFIFCLSFLFSKKTFLGNTIFFALLSVYHSCLWCVFD